MFWKHLEAFPWVSFHIRSNQLLSKKRAWGHLAEKCVYSASWSLPQCVLDVCQVSEWLMDQCHSWEKDKAEDLEDERWWCSEIKGNEEERVLCAFTGIVEDLKQAALKGVGPFAQRMITCLSSPADSNKNPRAEQCCDSAGLMPGVISLWL